VTSKLVLSQTISDFFIKAFTFKIPVNLYKLSTFQTFSTLYNSSKVIIIKHIYFILNLKNVEYEYQTSFVLGLSLIR